MSKAHTALLLILQVFFVCTDAGVFPNYHSSFDFVTWSKDDQSQNFSTRIESLNPVDTLSIYQIYPRSFQDSDGNGVGDLNGITSRLEFLKQLGVGAVWISPIFRSPMADFGYDIANYTEIDPIFGTMADFERLLARGRELGIAVLLDFVPNHTSDESEWFKLSAARDPFYKDFYVWHKGQTDAAGERRPPTNWRSVFRGSAWTWHEGRGEYYLHQFLAKQPDLNYRNSKVREAMQNVLRFWLEKGVGGFRVDAVPFAFEIAADEHGNWPDEPRNDWVNDPDDYGYLKHIYTVDQPETLNLVYEWRSVLKSFDNTDGSDLPRLLLTEAYSPLDVVMKYYGNGTVEGAQVPFNFLLIGNLNNGSKADDYANTINDWLSHMPAGRAANWVLGNHDQNRIGSRLGTDRIDMLNMLILTLPGVSVTYQGEELGMTDVWISWNDTVDPSACNSNPDIYEKFSRDPERTPYQWNAEQNAGFSQANKTWLPIASNYKEVNWASEVVSAPTVDHLNVYMSAMKLRKEPTFKLGQTKVKSLNSAVLVVQRSLLNAPTYITVLNLFNGTETVDLKQLSDDLPEQLEYVVVNEFSTAKVGDRANTISLRLLPKEAVVLRTATKLTTSYGYYTYYTSGISVLTHFGPYLIALWQIVLAYLH